MILEQPATPVHAAEGKGVQREIHGDKAEIIALIGIDGSGKSTLSHRLADWIASRGAAATCRKTVSGRSQLDKLAQRLGSRELSEVVGSDAALMMQAAVVWRNLRDARPLVRTPQHFAVMDRYTHCHLALTRIFAPEREPFVRALFAKFRAPDVCLFVDTPPEVAFARLSARGDASNTLEFLTAFDRAYGGLPEAVDYVRIDGSATPDDVFAQACDKLSARYSALA
jgi:dTMP kinase